MRHCGHVNQCASALWAERRFDHHKKAINPFGKILGKCRPTAKIKLGHLGSKQASTQHLQAHPPLQHDGAAHHPARGLTIWTMAAPADQEEAKMWLSGYPFGLQLEL